MNQRIPRVFLIAMLCVAPECDGEGLPFERAVALEAPSDLQAPQFTTVEFVSGTLGEGETTPGELSSLPPAAVAQLLGPSGMQFVLTQEAPDAPVRFQRHVFTINPNLPRASAEDLERAGPRPVLPLAALPEKDAELVHDDSGGVLVYLRFVPSIPPDAPYRVDWAVLENREAPHLALLRAEENRQMELEAAALENASSLKDETDCVWIGRSRAANSGYAWCTDLQALATRAFIEAVDPVNAVSSALNGDDFRAASGMQNGHMIDQLADGKTGRPLSGRSHVEIAVIDKDGFNQPQLHPAYNDTSLGHTRVTRRRSCTTTSCTNAPSVTGAEGVHGELVLGAFGDLLDGQDATVTSTPDREDRSYGAPEADLELYYVASGTTAAIATAIEDAVSTDDGVDIVYATSYVSGCAQANSFLDVKDAWDLAYSLGALGIVPAGNSVNRTNDDCTVNGLATRTDIVVVGAEGEDVSSTAGSGTWLPGRTTTPIASWVLDTQPLYGWHYTDVSLQDNCPNRPAGKAPCPSSAIGGGVLNRGFLGMHAAWSGVDLVAPSGREKSARFVSGTSSYGTTCCGTSYAGAEVAAVTASVLDWAYSAGQTFFNQPGFTHVNLLLMGDVSAGPLYMTKHFQWGAGRVQARMFNAEGMDAPWGWQGGVISYDSWAPVLYFRVGTDFIPYGVDYIRAAIAWDEPNLDATGGGEVADVILQLAWTERPQTPNLPHLDLPCPAGPIVVPMLLASSVTEDPEKFVEYTGPGMANRCVYLVIVGTVPLGQPAREIYNAIYWEDRARDDADGPASGIQ